MSWFSSQHAEDTCHIMTGVNNSFIIINQIYSIIDCNTFSHFYIENLREPTLNRMRVWII